MMQKLSIKEQGQIVFATLEPYYGEFDFIKKSYQNVSNSFVSKTDFGLNYIYFQFKSNGQTDFSLGISHSKVEKVIMDVGHPNLDYSEDIKNEDFSRGTLFDSSKRIPYDVESLPVLTAERAERYAKAVIEYMKEFGWSFFQSYNQLPNVLAKMNKLENEGKYWNGWHGQGGLISGGSDSFFRGLIISKLCNDPDYDRKIKMVDELFNDNSDKWYPYYKRLKDRLATLNPQ